MNDTFLMNIGDELKLIRLEFEKIRLLLESSQGHKPKDPRTNSHRRPAARR